MQQTRSAPRPGGGAALAADPCVGPTIVGEPELLARLWGAHGGLALVVVGPLVWFTRRRVSWKWWEFLALLVPFGIWWALISTTLRPKSLANLGECGYISIAIVVAAAVRVLLGRRGDARWVPITLFLGVVAASLGTYFLTPPWP